MTNDYLDAINFIKNGYCEAGLLNLKKESNLNNSEALYILGELYQNGLCVERNFDIAISYYEKAALFGSIDALVNLGCIYKNLNNLEKAFYYFSLSANLNSFIGQFNLGTMYEFGIYVSKDYSLAFKYYSLSAEQGYIFAYLNLGYLYAEGLGVKQDYLKSFELWTLAEKEGNIQAKNNLEKLKPLLL